MIAVYALANITGMGHLFRPLGCVGHIGGHVHYRSSSCDFSGDSDDARLLSRARQMIELPSTIEEEAVEGWEQQLVRAESFKWEKVLGELGEAVQQQQPTLFLAEHVNSLTTTYPDLFYALPQLRPSEPLPPLTCRSSSSGSSSSSSAGVHNKPWMLDALRFAIHIRRGDVVTDGWSERILSTQYYINLARTVTKVLEAAGCQYTVEVHTETPRTPEMVEELHTLKRGIPNAVMLPGKDLLWTWQMMATADILVMSNSMFSVSAALLNPDAISIHVPPRQAVVRQGMFKLRHWIAPEDENGTMADAAMDVIRQRVGLRPQATWRRIE
ncbi:hypothetical protein OEZ85_000811 [Tetradesmus obliquus]|uniref:O-fucosyltransferase family protein n=1 Tax=Tetradesmus obliquus TaxID=3088 RepID=A0ABY8UJS8_TETOB|nr:hypothetical protein OEZ85_000811 [Tetradesmus obliquus]